MNKKKFTAKSTDFSDISSPKKQVKKAKEIIEKYKKEIIEK